MWQWRASPPWRRGALERENRRKAAHLSTHAPLHMRRRERTVRPQLALRSGLGAGVALAIPTTGALVAAAPAMAAPGTGTTTPSATTPTVKPVLFFGSRGEAVKAIQAQLQVNADGIFGPATLSAVKSFQRSNGLYADGIVGKLTWAKLAAATTPTTPTTPATPARRVRRLDRPRGGRRSRPARRCPDHRARQGTPARQGRHLAGSAPPPSHRHPVPAPLRSSGNPSDQWSRNCAARPGAARPDRTGRGRPGRTTRRHHDRCWPGNPRPRTEA
mgnify:CR=1 FL=1